MIWYDYKALRERGQEAVQNILMGSISTPHVPGLGPEVWVFLSFIWSAKQIVVRTVGMIQPDVWRSLVNY